MEQPPAIAESIVQTQPVPSAPMREIISLPPPAVALQTRHHQIPATICMWKLFNRSGNYWLTGTKCARTRILHEGVDGRLRKKSICAIKCHFCCCFYCSWFGGKGEPCCGIELCGACGEDDEEYETPTSSPRVQRSGSSIHTATENGNESLHREIGAISPAPDTTEAPLEMKGYIVVGLLDSKTGGVREQLERIVDDDGLFRSIRKAIKALRPLYIRVFSLKTVGGFGLYRCEPSGDYHIPIDLDDQSSATFYELFSAYSSYDVDWESRWKTWVHEHLNGSSTDPQAGSYTLRLILRWSIVKLVVYTTIPVALSLAVGLWFMLVASKDLDDSYTAVVQTAWSISSYIITTAGGRSCYRSYSYTKADFWFSDCSIACCSNSARRQAINGHSRIR